MSNDHVRLLAANLYTRRLMKLEQDSEQPAPITPAVARLVADSSIRRAVIFYEIFDEFREKRALEASSPAAATVGRYHD